MARVIKGGILAAGCWSARSGDPAKRGYWLLVAGCSMADESFIGLIEQLLNRPLILESIDRAVYFNPQSGT